MSIHAIAPSPLARLLLELEARAASGGIDAGGRRLVLSKGALAEVRPAADDASLGEFLVAAGRLSEADLELSKQHASERRASLEASLRQRDLVPIDVLLETRRALWLDRFVRGLSIEEQAGRQPSLLAPEPHPVPGPAIPLLPFTLDALARRASFGDAERVGRHATAWFEWLDTPQRERAQAWADFGELTEAVPASLIFARHPAAPSRIAALVRAGLARLSAQRVSLPPPAPRNPGIAAPAPELAPAGRGSIEPPPLTPIPPLEPGQVRLDGGPLRIEPLKSWFPGPAGGLDDPLDAVERRIARLEQAGASATDRARAWLDCAEAWRTHHDSPEEAARASREAATAAPNDPSALEAAAVACSAVGRPDLAYAYASTWAQATAEPAQRARAWLQTAGYATRAAKAPSALRALHQACELDPDDALVAERHARALAGLGDVAGAVQMARRSAERHRADRPAAASAVLAWANKLAPDDAELASDWASSLAAAGLGEAAVAVLARSARRAESPERARKLWMNAAVRAELAGRPDLASDLLLEALDAELGDSAPLREPLLHDLTSAGAVVEVALIAEELAARAHGAERARHLVAAADARVELPGDSGLALELYTQALIADAGNARALAGIVQLGEASELEPRSLFDAIERALSADERSAQPAQSLALLEQFLSRLQADGGAPALERWAFALSERLGGRGPSADEQRSLEARLGQFEAEVRRLEAELRNREAESRAQPALELAERLRDDPARRNKAKKLYEKILDQEPAHALARQRLQALARLEGDARALCALASHRVVQATSGFSRVAAQLAWVHAERAAGNLRGAVEACLSLLAQAPKNREGGLLLLRLAHAARDPVLMRDALARRAQASLDPRERARALVALARALMLAGEQGEALRHAESALFADPRCAEAAFILLDHHAALEPAHTIPNLRAVRGVLGDSRELLELLAQACYRGRDARGQLEALEALLELAPFDTFPAAGLAALRATGSDPQAIVQALRAVLSSARFGDGSLNAALLGLERLWALGQRREAVQLVLEAIDQLAEQADELLDWVVPALREVDDPRLSRAVLERTVVRSVGEAKAAALRRLAYFHREQGCRHAEARAFLRLLAFEPADAEALERLAFLYAETRESERLMAVLTLRLDLATTPDERRERLLSLACAALDLADDPAGAEDLVRAALAVANAEDEPADPPLDTLRRGLGLLLGSKSPQLAFDLLLQLSESASPERASGMLEEAVCLAERNLQNPDLALRAATLGLESHPSHMAFLLHFERLALQIGDIATGREVYRHLSDSSMGMHGRRAVLYRAGRWLERAGALTDALAAVEQAFVLAPSEGAVLVTLERLAHAVGDHGSLVRALRVLADAAPLPRTKAQLLARAALLCETELDDAARAGGLYELAFRTLPDAELELRALACAKRLESTDPEGARAAYDRFRDLLIEQAAEAWSTIARCRALLSLARLSLDVYASEPDASRHLAAAKAAIDGDEDLPSDARRELVDHHANLLVRAERARPAPQPAVAPARERRQTLSRIEPAAIALENRAASAPLSSGQAAAARIASEPPYDPRARVTQPGGRVQHRVGDAAPANRARDTDPGLSPNAAPKQRLGLEARMTRRGFAPPIPREDPPDPTPESETQEASSPRVRVNASDEEQLFDGVLGGDPAAAAQLLGSLPSEPDAGARLCGALLRRARAPGLTLLSLRGLQLVGAALRPGLGQVCAEALAHVDPPGRRTPARSTDAAAAATLTSALVEAREDAAYAPAFTLLAHVFHGAGPLFRRSLTSYGISASDFLAPIEESPYTVGLREVAALFGVEHEVYLRHSGEDRIAIIPTHPPCILVADKTHGDAAALRFRFARMFEYARAGSALLATLAPESAEILFAALRAAFGPTDAKTPPVQREAAAMAAELWRTMPSNVQRQVGNLFRVVPDLPAHAVLMEHLWLRAARVALIACGSLDIALATLGLDGDPAGLRVARDAAALDRALRDQPVARGLVEFALSDAYLALRDELAAPA